MVVAVGITVLWVVTPQILVDMCWCFGGICCFHCQGGHKKKLCAEETSDARMSGHGIRENKYEWCINSVASGIPFQRHSFPFRFHHSCLSVDYM